MPINQMLSIFEIKDVSSVIVFVLFMLLSLIQIAPIKMNPWDKIFKWIGKRVNAELEAKVILLEQQIETTRKDNEERVISDMRWHILNFACACRNSETHTKEQWNHVLTQAKKYELYIKEHELDNGVIEEDTKYIRELYRNLSKEGKIK